MESSARNGGALRSTARKVVRAVHPSGVRPAFPWEARRADELYGVPGEPDWRQIDWREHLHDAKVSGRRMRYVDIGTGEGTPVVFVHGLGGNWQNWLENLPAIAQHRRAIAMDLPGFGESEMPADKISITSYGRWVDELLERLELDRVAVVGNSMGGFIGAEMAISYAVRVDRLVLTAAAGITTTTLHRRPLLAGARIAAGAAAFAASRSREVVARPRLRHAVFGTVFRHPTRMPPDILIECVKGSGRRGFLPALDALTSYDFTDRLPEVRCPTLLVWGNKDMLVPLRDADEYARHIPDARKVVFEDVGHVPMLERPRAFNEVLLEFLQDDGPERVGARDERAEGGRREEPVER